MATVFIPSMLRQFTGGHSTVEVRGSTVRAIVDGLIERYPDVADRLVEGGQVRSNISVAIDGEVSTLGMLDSVDQDSEVHFIPAIAGGTRRADAEPVG